MNCYAKDMKPSYLICNHGDGWLEVTEVKRDRSLARQAMTNQYVTDMEITILRRATGEIYTEEVNSHAVYKDVVEG